MNLKSQKTSALNHSSQCPVVELVLGRVHPDLQSERAINTVANHNHRVPMQEAASAARLDVGP